VGKTSSVPKKNQEQGDRPNAARRQVDLQTTTREGRDQEKGIVRGQRMRIMGMGKGPAIGLFYIHHKRVVLGTDGVFNPKMYHNKDLGNRGA